MKPNNEQTRQGLSAQFRLALRRTTNTNNNTGGNGASTVATAGPPHGPPASAPPVADAATGGNGVNQADIERMVGNIPVNTIDGVNTGGGDSTSSTTHNIPNSLDDPSPAKATTTIINHNNNKEDNNTASATAAAAAAAAADGEGVVTAPTLGLLGGPTQSWGHRCASYSTEENQQSCKFYHLTEGIITNSSNHYCRDCTYYMCSAACDARQESGTGPGPDGLYDMICYFCHHGTQRPNNYLPTQPPPQDPNEVVANNNPPIMPPPQVPVPPLQDPFPPPAAVAGEGGDEGENNNSLPGHGTDNLLNKELETRPHAYYNNDPFQPNEKELEWRKTFSDQMTKDAYTFACNVFPTCLKYTPEMDQHSSNQGGTRKTNKAPSAEDLLKGQCRSLTSYFIHYWEHITGGQQLTYHKSSDGNLVANDPILGKSFQFDDGNIPKWVESEIGPLSSQTKTARDNRAAGGNKGPPVPLDMRQFHDYAPYKPRLGPDTYIILYCKECHSHHGFWIPVIILGFHTEKSLMVEINGGKTKKRGRPKDPEKQKKKQKKKVSSEDKEDDSSTQPPNPMEKPPPSKPSGTANPTTPPKVYTEEELNEADDTTIWMEVLAIYPHKLDCQHCNSGTSDILYEYQQNGIITASLNPFVFNCDFSQSITTSTNPFTAIDNHLKSLKNSVLYQPLPNNQYNNNHLDELREMGIPDPTEPVQKQNSQWYQDYGEFVGQPDFSTTDRKISYLPANEDEVTIPHPAVKTFLARLILLLSMQMNPSEWFPYKFDKMHFAYLDIKFGNGLSPQRLKKHPIGSANAAFHLVQRALTFLSGGRTEVVWPVNYMAAWKVDVSKTHPDFQLSHKDGQIMKRYTPGGSTLPGSIMVPLSNDGRDIYFGGLHDIRKCQPYHALLWNNNIAHGGLGYKRGSSPRLSIHLHIHSNCQDHKLSSLDYDTGPTAPMTRFNLVSLKTITVADMFLEQAKRFSLMAEFMREKKYIFKLYNGKNNGAVNEFLAEHGLGAFEPTKFFAKWVNDIMVQTYAVHRDLGFTNQSSVAKFLRAAVPDLNHTPAVASIGDIREETRKALLDLVDDSIHILMEKEEEEEPEKLRKLLQALVGAEEAQKRLSLLDKTRERMVEGDIRDSHVRLKASVEQSLAAESVVERGIQQSTWARRVGTMGFISPINMTLPPIGAAMVGMEEEDTEAHVAAGDHPNVVDPAAADNPDPQFPAAGPAVADDPNAVAAVEETNAGRIEDIDQLREANENDEG